MSVGLIEGVFLMTGPGIPNVVLQIPYKTPLRIM